MAHRSRLARRTFLSAFVAFLVLVPAGSALACGGLVTPNGTVSLLKTTTLAAYHAGVEHYVTSFEFAGTDATEVGSIVPLPGVPTKVIKGGDWTLQRLILETQPAERTVAFAAADSAGGAIVLLETQIDALDVTVLQGGAADVGEWASDHGFFLPPDAPEVLEFYAARSPIFMAVKFDVGRANEQGVQQGQGTPVHVVIPTPNPWVPLRILALGRDESDLVRADVYLLTDVRPATLPLAERADGSEDQNGLIEEYGQEASASLLADLRSDRGMKWLPTDGMWLTQIRVNAFAGDLTHDLAIDASGFGQPSPAAAGLQLPFVSDTNHELRPVVWLSIAALVAIGVAVALVAGVALPTRRPDPRRTATMALTRGSGSLRALGGGLVLAALVLLSASTAIAAGWFENSREEPAARTVVLRIHYSAFDPGVIDVEPGQTIRFVIENTDPIDHEFIIGDEGVQLVHERGTEAHHPPRPGEVSVPAGERVATTITFPAAPQALIFGCHLPGHYAYGMRGDIRVG